MEGFHVISHPLVAVSRVAALHAGEVLSAGIVEHIVDGVESYLNCGKLDS